MILNEVCGSRVKVIPDHAKILFSEHSYFPPSPIWFILHINRAAVIIIALNQVNVSVIVDFNLAQVEKTRLYVIGNDIELKVLFQVIITIKIKFSELLLITMSTIKSGTFGLVMVTCTISMLSCFSLCLKCVEPLVLIFIRFSFFCH